MRQWFRTLSPLTVVLAPLAACLALGCSSTNKSKSGSSADVGAGAGEQDTGGFQVDDGDTAGAGGGDTSGGTDSGAGDTTGGTDGESSSTSVKGFPSPELFIQIVGPGERSHVGSTSSVITLNGVLFGRAKEIVWQSTKGETGTASGNEFWSTGPIALDQGDNQIIVTATDDAGNASIDTVIVTYSPGVAFDSPAVARPESLFTGASQRVAVSIRTPSAAVMPDTFVLYEVDATGATLGMVGPMIDSGDLATDCDEIAGDGVFSRCIQVQDATPTTRFLRVNAKVQAGAALTTLMSPLTAIDVVDPLLPADCNAMKDVEKGALNAYNAALGNGALAAAQAALQALNASPLVAEAGRNDVGYGIWVRYKNGILGALNVGNASTRGGNGNGQFGSVSAPLGNRVPLESRNVLALAPANEQLGPFDETPQIAAQLGAKDCPDFTVQGPYLNAGAGLAQFRSGAGAGIMLFSGHSDGYFKEMDPVLKDKLGWEHSGTQEILWSGEAVDCSALATTMASCTVDSDCSGASVCVLNDEGPKGVCVDQTVVDLRRGRVIFGAETWGVHPELFRKYAPRGWADSLVYLGGCRTMYSGSLAGALFGLGAKAIAGYTDYVSSAFASEQAKNWFTRMMADGTTTGLAATFPIPEPEHAPNQFVLFGGPNVSISESEILNPSWESGDTTGWAVTGDGRVIGRLGATLAPSGKFMGIVSTGLGYTQTTGELAQSFCIPAGKKELTVYWRFYSEEFKDFCGSEYQDAFEATLETQSGSVDMVNVRVDDLCGQNDNDCWTCGSQAVGLDPSDVGFDIGDVWMTPWQTAKVDVSGVAGKGPVTLRLFTTDTGDSIYDTAVLLDGVLID